MKFLEAANGTMRLQAEEKEIKCGRCGVTIKTTKNKKWYYCEAALKLICGDCIKTSSCTSVNREHTDYIITEMEILKAVEE